MEPLEPRTLLSISIEMVAVGNPDNVGEPSGAGAFSSAGVPGYGPSRVCGAVDYAYQIGKYEVTAGQYTEFLNSVAATDTYALYNPEMGSGRFPCGIQRSGSSGSYTYTVSAQWAQRPVTWTSFWDAARFANWMNNGQGNGNTETGAYTLNGYTGSDGRWIVKNPDAKWWIPSEDEWYKAAYYDPNKPGGPGYWDYSTGTDATPGGDMSETTNPGNNANYNSYIGYYSTTDVGAFRLSDGAYGTFDQGGNVWEWNDSVLVLYPDAAARGMRAGSSCSGANELLGVYRGYGAAPNADLHGFRLAAAVDLNTPPAVTITGAPATSPEGATINLGSTVTGTGPFDYAWNVTKDGNPYASGNSASLSFTPGDNGSYAVSLGVTPQAYQYVRQIPLGFASDAADFDSSGNLWVVDSSAGGVVKLSNSGAVLARIGYGVLSPSNALALDLDGNVWVGDNGQNRFVKFDQNGNVKLTIASAYGTAPHMAFDSSGNMWAFHADNWGGTYYLRQFNAQTGAILQTWTGVTVTPWGGGGIAIDAAGNIWVSQNNDIHEYSPTGQELLHFGSYGSGQGQFNNPIGLAIDQFNNLYVADASNQRVQKFDGNGRFLAAFGSWGSGQGSFAIPSA